MTDALPHIYSGKVRDIYDAGDNRLLMVTSDRLSAFDVVMAEPIPEKGRVLTAMTRHGGQDWRTNVAQGAIARPATPAASLRGLLCCLPLPSYMAAGV